MLHTISDTIDSWQIFTNNLLFFIVDKVKIITDKPSMGWGSMDRNRNETGVVVWTRRESLPVHPDDTGYGPEFDDRTEVVVGFPSHATWQTLEKEIRKV